MTENDYAVKMDEAAIKAEQELRQMTQEPLSIIEFFAWYQAWYTLAGHRRLGRIIVRVGKEIQ